MTKDKPLKTEYRKVEDLFPYARNARTHSDEQVSRIAASIREFGWTQPILIGDDDTVIAGHGRLAAAKKLGMTEVPTIRLSGLTKEQLRAYVLVDNRLAEDAGWDKELLGLELSELKDSGFDLDLIGFSSDEIDQMIAGVEERPQEAEDADIPEPEENPVTKRDDIWLLGVHRLMCGDSTCAEDTSRLMGGGTRVPVSNRPAV